MRTCSDPEGPMELVCADALLGAAQEIEPLGPVAHRDMPGLEDGANLDRELVAALVALPQADPVAVTLRTCPHPTHPRPHCASGENRDLSRARHPGVGMFAHCHLTYTRSCRPEHTLAAKRC